MTLASRILRALVDDVGMDEVEAELERVRAERARPDTEALAAAVRSTCLACGGRGEWWEDRARGVRAEIRCLACRGTGVVLLSWSEAR